MSEPRYRHGCALPIQGPKPPPVDQRPSCAGCQKPRRPRMRYIFSGENDSGPAIARRWTGGWDGYEHFCTQRCATAFANRIVNERAGKARGR